jgi:CheY-like chemotaxis protein
VLVADWMLRHSIHGLHVAEVLHAADPALHTVLVTGFPATDLTIDRDRVGIVEMLEKPFDVDALGAAVARAARAPASDGGDGIGVLMVDAAGAIQHRNAAARELLAGTTAGGDVAGLGALLPPEAALRVRDGCDRWTRVAPEGSDGPAFWTRARALEGDLRLIALCPIAEEWRRHDPRTRMLLGLPLGGGGGRFRDPVLLVDDSRAVCETFVAQLESRGCTARAAASHTRALELFRADPELRVVILDWAMPGEDLRTTVAQLRELRPGVRLIGTSGEDRRAEFGELGIDAFLLKPWTVSGDLASLLSGGSPAPALEP